MIQLVKKRGYVFLRLAELAVYDGVEIYAEQISLQNAGDLSDGFGFTCAGSTLEQKFIDSHVPLDGIDDSEDVFFD